MKIMKPCSKSFLNDTGSFIRGMQISVEVTQNTSVKIEEVIDYFLFSLYKT